MSAFDHHVNETIIFAYYNTMETLRCLYDNIRPAIRPQISVNELTMMSIIRCPTK